MATGEHGAGRGGRFSSGMDLLFKSRLCFYFYIQLLRAIL